MFIIKLFKNILISCFILLYVSLESKEISKDDFVFLTNKIIKETQWQDWIHFDCLNPEKTFPDSAKVIISPGGGDGWVEYRISIGTDTNKTVSLEFIWTDNAWFSGIKKCYLYNWTKNIYQEVWSSKENKGKEENTKILIKKEFINNPNGIVLIKFIATSTSVMHIKELKLIIAQK